MVSVMNNLTILIKQEIKRQYKSARRFALSIGMPPTTLASTLKNGVEGTSFDTILKICEALDIHFIEDSIPIKFTERSLNLIKKYETLDSVGKHTIDAVLSAEFSRCDKNSFDSGLAVAFGGKQIHTKSTDDDVKSAHEALKKHKNR